MEVIKISPRGYCKGVVQAIAKAKETRLKYPHEDIYILGMLVHNQYVIDALNLLNIKTLEDPKSDRLDLMNQVPDESIVIFTAHGISKQVIQKAKDKNCHYVDASCENVLQTQNIVEDYLKQDYDVLYIGKHLHPEAQAVLALSKHVHLITNLADIHNSPNFDKVFVTNQTTMSIFDVKKLFDEIKSKYPHAIISDEICNATRIRQEAIAKLKGSDIDLVYIVGDTKSNNSKKLAQIALEQGIKQVYLIDSVNDINDEQLNNIKKVGVSAGASTPTYLTNQVIQYLENYEQNKVKPNIDLQQIL